jgi:hypothetical protein
MSPFFVRKDVAMLPKRGWRGVLVLVLLMGLPGILQARTGVIEWDAYPQSGVTLMLQACVLDAAGTCVMTDVQAIPGYRLRTEVYVPDGTTRCFTIKAVTEGRDSPPSNRVCLK